MNTFLYFMLICTILVAILEFRFRHSTHHIGRWVPLVPFVLILLYCGWIIFNVVRGLPPGRIQ